MKMTKLFTTVFGEELQSRGFIKKAKLYYRLNGDILQAVIIKTINPYTIHFYSAPYWMENIQAELSPLYKGYWAEYGICISPGAGAYYREENEQLNTDYMNICLSLSKKYILPIMDQIHDLNSYLQYCTPKWKDISNEKSNERVIEILPEEIDESYSYIDSQVKLIWQYWDELYMYSAFLKHACEEGNLQIGLDLLEEKDKILPTFINANRFAQNKYMEYMSDDGLERAKQYFAQRRAIMLPRLRDELGLDTFNL